MDYENVQVNAPNAFNYNLEISKRFPFANLDGEHAAPEWAKRLLIQKYSLKEVGEVIRFID